MDKPPDIKALGYTICFRNLCALQTVSYWLGTLNRRQKPVEIRQPENVTWTWLDRYTGYLSAQGCGGAMYIPILRNNMPDRATECATYGSSFNSNNESEASAPVDSIENLIQQSDNTDENGGRVISSGSFSE